MQTKSQSMDKHLKVAVVYRMDHPGGVQSVALALIRGLNSQGIIPDVLWDLPPSPSLLDRAGCQAGYQPLRFRIPSTWIDRMPDTLRYLAWIFNITDGGKLSQSYDFYYVFFNGFITPINRPHLRYLNGPPLLPQLEKFSPGPRGWLVRFFRWIYRRFLSQRLPVYEYHPRSPYVVNSLYIRGLFEETYGVRLPVVYPPIQMNGRSFSFDDLDERDTITFFSRIVAYKRPEMVLELAARYPAYRYTIMGGVPPHRVPYFESLQAQAQQLGINNINFLANPPEGRVRSELARTRFYIFPAVNEHFGMTTVEAAASGAIPFVHNSGGQREIVHLDILRFKDEDYFVHFADLEKRPAEELNLIREALQTYIQRFAEPVSVTQLLAYLDGIPAPLDWADPSGVVWPQK